METEPTPTSHDAGPTVMPPRQARSRATMERILTAVEELLAEKPFEQITIAEISARSASAPTAIYARFSDKTALLLGVHERFRERAAARIIDLITDDRRTALAPEEYLGFVAAEAVALYSANHRLLRSVLLADSPVMYARAAELGTALSTAISGRLASRIPPDRLAAAERDIDFAVRTMLALTQQSLVFGAHPPTRFDHSDEQIVARVTRILHDAAAPHLSEIRQGSTP